jgi:hypothetical protein
MATTEKPYGDVSYADPGYRDGQKRYPVDTEAHCRAAWSYIHQADNRRFYTAEQLSAIEGRIKAAGKKYGIEFEGSAKSDYLITLGPAVKAMGDGKVSGYLVTWGSEATKDAEGEWFTPETDFDAEFPARASVYYHHGQDPAIGRRRLTHGAMEADEFGVRIDAQLDMRDPSQAAVYRKVEKGELGWSSGSLSHITIPPRESPGGAIRQWPLGHDASLTWIPSDRRNVAVAVKSALLPPVLAPLTEEGIRSAPGSHRDESRWGPSLAENTDRWMDDGMYVLSGYSAVAAKAGRKLSSARRERLMQMRQMIEDLLSETEPREAAAALEGSPSPGMGEGAGGEGPAAASRALELPITSLPDLHDLYTAAVRQYRAPIDGLVGNGYAGAAPIPTGG